MTKNPISELIFQRKDDHVNLALSQDTAKRRSAHFDDLRFIHNPLAAIDVELVVLGTEVAGANWQLPFYINGMTGGSEFTGKINQALAIAAAETGIAIASGSMSAYFKDPACAPSFRYLRAENPHGFVMANLSANANLGQAQTVVEVLEANALQIHLNPVQELVMPEGDREFSHLLRNLEKITAALDVPVIVKEVGFGMSAHTITALSEIGVTWVDVGGNGGTDFAQIENSRRSTDFSLLNGWGQSAVNSLLDCSDAASAESVQLLASGGVRNPLDVVKALSLGAKAVGIAGGFLATVTDGGPEALIEQINTWKTQCTAIMALLGAAEVSSLTQTDLVISGAVREFADARSLDFRKYAQRSNQSSQQNPQKIGGNRG